MRLCYLKDGKFHEKSFTDRNEATIAFRKLKATNLPFCVTEYTYWTGIKLAKYNGFGQSLSRKNFDLSDLPPTVREKFESFLDENKREDRDDEYGGKVECMWFIYRCAGHYYMKLDLGEDCYENQVILMLYVSEDGSSTFEI